MPTIKTPTLTLGKTINNKRDVTVAGDISFDAGDVGRTYRLEINVYGEDKNGDALPPGDAIGDDLIYTYNWPGPFMFLRPYRIITVTVPGSLSFSEKRAVDIGILDEDPGMKKIPGPLGHPPLLLPRKDEVYAKVTLGCMPMTVQTPTVTTPEFGV